MSGIQPDQRYRIHSTLQQQPQNFPDTPNIGQWPAAAAGSNKEATAAISIASNEPLPDEPSALVGIKRMAIGEYLREITAWQTGHWYPPFAPDEAALTQEIANASVSAQQLLQHSGLEGTPIDVERMAAEPYARMQDYAGRPWEDDAFFCETVAGGYWDFFAGRGLSTLPADQCSPAYVLASKAADLVARINDNNQSGAAASER